MHYVTLDDWYFPYLVKLFDYSVPTITQKDVYDFNDMGVEAIAYVSSELLADNTLFNEYYLVVNSEGNIYKLTEKTKVYGGTRGWRRSVELLAEPYLNITNGASMTMLDETTAVISTSSASGVTLWSFDLNTNEVAYMGILNGVTDLVGLSLTSQIQKPGQIYAANKGTGHIMEVNGARAAVTEPKSQNISIYDGVVKLNISEPGTNGKLVVTFDPEALTYVSASSASALYSVNDAEAEDGKLVIAFASATALSAENILATLEFSYETIAVDTTITVTTTERNDEDGLNEQNVIDICNNMSGDSTLRTLKVAEGELSPIFAPQVLDYSITVPYDVEQLTITAVANDEKAAVAVENPELVPGETTKVTITVTAENGERRFYTIHATREAEHVHTPVTIPGYPATCTEPGMTDGQYCTVCKTILVEWEVIPASGHNFENGVCTGCGDRDENFVAAPVITASNIAKTGKVKLTWTAVEGAAEYILYLCDADGNVLKATPTTKTVMNHNSGKVGVAYKYYVVAVAENGTTSEPSNTVKRVCDLAQTEVTVSNIAKTGKIRVSWNEVEGATKYTLYTYDQDGNLIKSYTTTKTAVTHNSAEAGVTYTYKVRAKCDVDAATSTYSAAKSRTCDLAQPEVTGKVNLLGNPKLTWDAVEGAVKYKVYRAESADGEYKLMKTVTGTSYTNTSNVAGTTYFYYVVAVCENTAGNSAASNVVTLTAK